MTVARVDLNDRITYERKGVDIVLMRVIGLYDEALKSP
jgi:hypothetical protein